MQEPEEILEATISQMPKRFTSSQFIRKAIKAGYPQKIIKQIGASAFLKKYAKNDFHRSKNWTKLDDETPLELQQAIEIVKSNGYRVLKPTTEWQEL